MSIFPVEIENIETHRPADVTSDAWRLAWNLPPGSVNMMGRAHRGLERSRGNASGVCHMAVEKSMKAMRNQLLRQPWTELTAFKVAIQEVF